MSPNPHASDIAQESKCPTDIFEAELAHAHAIAAAVVDPEIPVLTLEDLGVLRGVERRDGHIVVKLTPTYPGGPATLAIQLAVEAALAEAGLTDRAEANTRRMLEGMLRPLGYDDVTVVFQAPPKP